VRRPFRPNPLSRPRLSNVHSHRPPAASPQRLLRKTSLLLRRRARLRLPIPGQPKIRLPMRCLYGTRRRPRKLSNHFSRDWELLRRLRRPKTNQQLRPYRKLLLLSRPPRHRRPPRMPRPQLRRPRVHRPRVPPRLRLVRRHNPSPELNQSRRQNSRAFRSRRAGWRTRLGERRSSRVVLARAQSLLRQDHRRRDHRRQDRKLVCLGHRPTLELRDRSRSLHRSKHSGMLRPRPTRPSRQSLHRPLPRRCITRRSPRSG
jgi:hypothetical protein